MTSSLEPTSPLPGSRKNWLERYIRLQVKYGREIDKELKEARDAIVREIEGMEPSMRRTQLVGAQGAITQVIKALWKKLGDLIREGSEDAALEAAKAMYEDEEDFLDEIVDDAAKLRVLRDALRQTAQRNVQAMMTRILETERPLSRRLYRAEALANQQVSRVVNQHLARGSSAADMARDIRDLVSPNQPGGVSMIAKRLARTEMNNAFHAQAINDMQDRPWIDTVRWHLSKSHPPNGDLCEQYANLGLFDVQSVPSKPHPQCLCYITPELPDRSTFLTNLQIGLYDEWVEENVPS